MKFANVTILFVFLAPLLGASSSLADSRIDANTLTRLVTSEADKLLDVQIVGAAEMRDALNLEASKQAAGCFDNSCIAEIAAAMGTSHVLQMQLGSVGETLLFTIQVFDNEARALGRESIQGKTIDEISRLLPPALKEVFSAAGLLEGKEIEDRSLLVLDLKASVQSTSTAEPAPSSRSPSPSPSLIFYGGAATLGLGVAGGVVGAILAGVFLVRNADLKGATQKEVLFWQAASLATTGVSALVAGAGVSLLAAC